MSGDCRSGAKLRLRERSREVKGLGLVPLIPRHTKQVEGR